LPSVYDVPPELLIEKLSKYLMENVEEVSPPPWAEYVKTGAPRQRPPDRDDWWYVRSASVLRKLYVRGPVGVSRLRLEYGGRKTGKRRPEHFKKGSGNILRKIFQQLEKAGLVRKESSKGRALSGKGRSLLDRLAAEIKEEMKSPER